MTDPDEKWQWWQDLLTDHRNDGRRDAEKGEYSPPYPISSDPTDDEENWAYREGFDERRKELGKDFRWR